MPTRLVAVVLVLAAGPASAKPQPPQPRQPPPPPRTSVTFVSLQPASIEAGKATEIAIGLNVTGAVPRSVELIRIGPNSEEQLLERFTRESGTRYVARRRFLEPRAGVVTLLARATFGDGPAAQRMVSDRFTLRVTPAAAVVQTGAVTLRGLTLSVPAAWVVQQATLDAGGPIALRNTTAPLPTGGVLPQGVCEIEATSTALPPGSLRDVVTQELEPRTIEMTTAAGRPAARATYRDTFAPNLEYEGVAVYIAGRTRLYKIFLAHRAGDAAGPGCRDAFNRVVGSTRVE